MQALTIPCRLEEGLREPRGRGARGALVDEGLGVGVGALARARERRVELRVAHGEEELRGRTDLVSSTNHAGWNDRPRVYGS